MLFYHKYKHYFFLCLLATFWAIWTPSVEAKNPQPTIRDSAYAAQYLSQSISDPVLIEAGTTKNIEIKFKNVGTATWKKAGGRHISAYTEVPRYRKSAFAGAGWVSQEQTTLMEPSVIAPGEVGTLTIPFHAPTTPGEYQEEFYLAAEGYTWLKGGYFYLKIIVVAPSQKAAVEKQEQLPITQIEESQTELQKKALGAQRTVLNKRSFEVQGGEQIKLIMGLRNTGEESWQEYGIIANKPDDNLTFADTSWESSSLIFEKNTSLSPDETTKDTFFLRAPTKKGAYTLSLAAVVNGEVLDDQLAEVKVTVTQDAPSHYKEPTFSNKNTPIMKARRLDKEPLIRVGVWKNPEQIIFVPNNDAYKVYNGLVKMGVLPSGKSANMTYNAKTGRFTFSSSELTFETDTYIRLVPENNIHATFTLPNYERTVSWRGKLSFNTYRGIFEYRSTKDKQDQYFINELPIEDYVAGVAEASNSDPIEFLKAQSIVSRTYAYYIMAYSDKHADRFFNVVAHTGDQLYLGVENEKITGNYVIATQATRGEMVTYDNNVVITPYFGNSDGRTRSWTEVWGGSQKPWLVSVPVVYDTGRKLFGHGVGMSQRDATLRAEKEHATYEELLKHYYTDINIERMYN